MLTTVARALRGSKSITWRSLSTSSYLCTHDVAGNKVPYYTKPSYCDSRALPLPDVPFVSELNPQQKALKVKEEGSWTQLTQEEKLALYRISFNQSFAEMKKGKPSEWKTVVGAVLYLLAFSGLYLWWHRVYGNGTQEAIAPPSGCHGNSLDLLDAVIAIDHGIQGIIRQSEHLRALAASSRPQLRYSSYVHVNYILSTM
ncbi:cytochrome c oxidase subunit 4 isoform 1, mitochondrial-like [Leptodactylus fuscus]|uniref:cytochrome c oxidase subunit 4 isoform 1, mitochondrial-like n=1 Tax=Leptodactylus fuscus TaxID=238119 RepID=UPI003F4F0082